MTARFGGWMSLSALVLVLDQITKFGIRSWLAVGEAVRVSQFFDLVMWYNRGAAFSFLSSAAGWQRWFFTVLAILISTWLVVLIRRHAHERLAPFAFALVLGGAIGNVIDRIAYGAVVDFLYFHIGVYGWPAFNVADSAISVGVVLLIWEQFAARRRIDALR